MIKGRHWLAIWLVALLAALWAVIARRRRRSTPRAR